MNSIKFCTRQASTQWGTDGVTPRDFKAAIRTLGLSQGRLSNCSTVSAPAINSRSRIATGSGTLRWPPAHLLAVLAWKPAEPCGTLRQLSQGAKNQGNVRHCRFKKSYTSLAQLRHSYFRLFPIRSAYIRISFQAKRLIIQAMVFEPDRPPPTTWMGCIGWVMAHT